MKTLLLVDIQNDFLPGGALAVPDGDKVIPVANRMMEEFGHVVATQDWHPQNHKSFASNHEGKDVGDHIDLNGLDQVLWPDHCVQNSTGAEFAEELDTENIDHVVRKGTDPEIDSYSGFYDNGHRKDTGLADYLRNNNIDELYILGLATDYCVKFTVLDALEEGFDVYLIEDGTRGIDMNEGDVRKSLDEMEKNGAKLVKSEDVNG